MDAVENMLRPFIGKTDNEVQHICESYEVHNTILQLMKELAEAIRDKLNPDEQNDFNAKLDERDCQVFEGHEIELTAILQRHVEENSGLFALLAYRKGDRVEQCNCSEHFYPWRGLESFQQHKDEGLVIQIDGTSRHGPMSQEDFIDQYNRNEYWFLPCGWTKDEITREISGKEKEIAENLAANWQDWCARFSRQFRGQDHDSSESEGMNQIPGIPGSCKERLRVLIPSKGEEMWGRFQKTLGMLKQCSSIHSVGFVIGQTGGEDSSNFEAVWLLFIKQYPEVLERPVFGMILANGDDNESIHHWNGASWE